MSSWHGGQRRTLCGADVRSRQPGARSHRQGLSTSDIRRLEDVSFERVVPRIAEWLDQVDARATFFTIGDYAQRYSGVIRQLANAGQRDRQSRGHPPHRLLGAERAELPRTRRSWPPWASRAASLEFTTSPALIKDSHRSRVCLRLVHRAILDGTDAEACLSCRGSGVGLPVIPRVLWMRQGPSGAVPNLGRRSV